ADEREMMLRGLQNQAEQLDALHAIPLDNSIAPAILFDPVPPGMELPRDSAPLRRSQPAVRRGVPDGDALAFLPVHELSELVRTRAVTSEQLTRLSLGRLQRFDPKLRCVVTLLEERALRSAREADREIEAGRYRGPLHGIPWGAKDLIGVEGAP